MGRWLLRRTFDALLTATVAVIALIVLVKLLPGDPLTALLGDRPAEPSVIAALQERWGTNRTILQSIASFFTGLAHGDLSVSLTQQRPVVDVLRDALGPTLLLGSLTLLIDFTIGLMLGLWTALHPDTWRARAISALTIIGYTVPTFVVGMLLVSVFAVKLHWFQLGGLADPLLAPDAPRWDLFVDHVRHLVLPLSAMVIATIAIPIRQQRNAALVTSAQPWVLAARGRGLSPAAVAWRHCWRPALTPVITLFGLWLPMLVAGGVFVEYVFQWPGIGLLIANATSNRDFPLVIGAGLVLILAVQLGSLVADVLYRVADPAQRTAP